MSGRLLLVLLDGASRAELESAVEERGEGIPTIYVVAPAHVGPLEWLATDEGRAYGEAGARALEAEWLLEGWGDVSGEAGAPDPVLAVEDALRRFRADEIVLVGRGPLDGTLVTALGEFGVPVSWVGLSWQAGTLRSRLRAGVRALASGRSDATPFVAFVGANLGLLLIGVVISIVALLIVWLIGLF